MHGEAVKATFDDSSYLSPHTTGFFREEHGTPMIAIILTLTESQGRGDDGALSLPVEHATNYQPSGTWEFLRHQHLWMQLHS
mmetsp:Transcript_9000/g.37139  ORF Transcript_9000/g.37139 Transcript_9000/m.37139 type:complete len:82 (+) Transcript_9000:726-971(+)